jgi:acyl-CoA thioester hydrolase
MTRARAQGRAHYRHFRALSTRWMDNDAYGHINNAVYYALFDSAVNGYLIERGVLDVANGGVIGLVVRSHCDYFSPLAYPQWVEAGLRVERIGRSSVTYGVAIFARDASEAAAQGEFVHVYVTREDRRPTELPAVLRAALEAIA